MLIEEQIPFSFEYEVSGTDSSFFIPLNLQCFDLSHDTWWAFLLAAKNGRADLHVCGKVKASTPLLWKKRAGDVVHDMSMAISEQCL